MVTEDVVASAMASECDAVSIVTVSLERKLACGGPELRERAKVLFESMSCALDPIRPFWAHVIFDDSTSTNPTRLNTTRRH